jgi:hypothetical protein
MDPAEDEARRDGWQSAAQRAEYMREFYEQEYSRAIFEGRAPAPAELWAQLEGAWIDDPPMTVEQAMTRFNLSDSTIRRRLKLWAALDPPLAYKVGRVWRILPAARDHTESAPSESRSIRAKRRRSTVPKPTGTRWQA